jgi:molecular chaperone GrpE
VGKDERDIDEVMNGHADANGEPAMDDVEAGIEEDAQAVIEKLMAQRDEYLDQLQRSRAEFINYRKRTDQERIRLGEIITANTLEQFLPVLDDFDRAMEAVPEDQAGSGWISGIAMIHTKLRGLLERAGVKEVDGVNAPFDPSVHEAVATEPGTRGDVVVEVYRKGYKLGDTLLRAAMVKTGDPVSEPAATNNADA